MNRTIKLGKNYCVKESDLKFLERLQKTHSEAEKKFQQAAKEAGWDVVRSGWPDYLIQKGNKIAFVEVKSKKDRLHLNQIKILNILSGLGLKCYTWRPADGFKLYLQNKPDLRLNGKRAGAHRSTQGLTKSWSKG